MNKEIKRTIKCAKEAIKNLDSEYELEKSLLRRVIMRIENGELNAIQTLKHLLHDMNDVLDHSLMIRLNEIVESY